MNIKVTAEDLASVSSLADAIEKALTRVGYEFDFVGVYYIFYKDRNPQLLPDEVRDCVDNFPRVKPFSFCV